MPEERPKQALTTITTDVTVAVLALLVGLAFFGVYLDRLAGWYQRLIEWFYSRGWKELVETLAIIFTIINAFLAAFIIFTIRRYSKLTGVVTPTEEVSTHLVLIPQEVRGGWVHIRELANSSNSSDWNMAVLRADALLDDALQHLGYEGKSLAERLKIVDPTKLKSLERVWSSHRLRNMIAHDPLEQHTRETIIYALRSYEQALKELGVMEEKSG